MNTLIFLKNKYKKRIENEKMNIWICSYGGSGTQFLYKKIINKYPKINSVVWHNHLCHFLHPISNSTVQYGIYIYRNPIIAVQSQLRKKMQLNFLKMNFNKMKENTIYKDISFSVDNYFFIMKEQMLYWSQSNVNFPILLIKYETFHKYINEFCNIFNIDSNTVDFCDPNKEIDVNMCEKFKIDMTTTNYKNAVEMYNSLPEFKIIYPNNGNNDIYNKKILIAILARNKAHTLPKYLECISNLQYNKSQIVIYINTNNNKDDTEKILEDWIDVNKDLYCNIEYDKHESDELKKTNSDPHNWNSIKFKKLGEIRNKSLQKTKEYNCDYYFVIDCDNFIAKHTLVDLISEKKPIIAPMLVPFNVNTAYSNFFCDIDKNGYLKNHPQYNKIRYYKIKDCHKVPLVHCTYLIDVKYIDKIGYDDNSYRYEFVIFSDMARKNNVEQYILNKKKYGSLMILPEDTTYDDEINIYNKLNHKIDEYYE